ncbi:hypothetical protein PM082_024248 [Marasmius tenuissimus]|nr:hypothetical protein PM082_024248 [Marasmius tenuissimus]
MRKPGSLFAPDAIIMDQHSLVLAISSDLQTQAVLTDTWKTYDWIICIPYEISYVWFSKWGLIKILFIYTRYSTFIDTIMALKKQIHDFENCSNESSSFNTIFSGFGIGICAMILMIWTYTLCKRSRRVLATFGLSWFVVGGIAAWAAVRWSKTFSAPATIVGDPSTGPICHLSQTSIIRFVNYTALLAGETVILVLTVWKAVQLAGGFQFRQIVKMFNECGVYFYLCIYCITVVDVALLGINPNRVFQLDSLLRAMHTVLCCRLVLHLRRIGVEKARRGEDEGSQITTLREVFGTPRRESFDLSERTHRTRKQSQEMLV